MDIYAHSLALSLTSPPPAASVLPPNGVARLIRKAKAADRHIASLIRQALVSGKRTKRSISTSTQAAVVHRVFEVQLLRKSANHEDALTHTLLLDDLLWEVAGPCHVGPERILSNGFKHPRQFAKRPGLVVPGVGLDHGVLLGHVSPNALLVEGSSPNFEAQESNVTLHE